MDSILRGTHIMQSAIARSHDSPFTGSTVDCLRHLIAKDPEAFVVLCQKRFGVVAGTARTWIGSTAVTPKAINMLYVQTLLVEQGYRLLELEALPNVLRRTRVFVAEGQLLVEELEKLWDIERGSVWRVLSGDRSTAAAKLDQLEHFLTKRFGGGETQQSFAGKSTHVLQSKVAGTNGVEVASSGRELIAAHQQVLDSAVQLARALDPLVEAIASDSFTKEERIYFRSLLGEGFVQNMRLHFAKLVNEKTRELILEKQRTGEA